MKEHGAPPQREGFLLQRPDCTCKMIDPSANPCRREPRFERERERQRESARPCATLATGNHIES
eukprot:1620409-Pyramimonas_sp.AAC.1